jgi:hypothetical protein
MVRSPGTRGGHRTAHGLLVVLHSHDLGEHGRYLASSIRISTGLGCLSTPGRKVLGFCITEMRIPCVAAR